GCGKPEIEDFAYNNYRSSTVSSNTNTSRSLVIRARQLKKHSTQHGVFLERTSEVPASTYSQPIEQVQVTQQRKKTKASCKDDSGVEHVENQ
ncbi:hypothetical protein KI387_013427, partial [Taxus chinensis]